MTTVMLMMMMMMMMMMINNNNSALDPVNELAQQENWICGHLRPGSAFVRTKRRAAIPLPRAHSGISFIASSHRHQR
eukprot:8162391-Karenia_brevis.AAC.1